MEVSAPSVIIAADTTTQSAGDASNTAQDIRTPQTSQGYVHELCQRLVGAQHLVEQTTTALTETAHHVSATTTAVSVQAYVAASVLARGQKTDHWRRRAVRVLQKIWGPPIVKLAIVRGAGLRKPACTARRTSTGGSRQPELARIFVRQSKRPNGQIVSFPCLCVECQQRTTINVLHPGGGAGPNAFPRPSVYNILDRDTFEMLEYYHNELEKAKTRDLVVTALVGNMIDQHPPPVRNPEHSHGFVMMTSRQRLRRIFRSLDASEVERTKRRKEQVRTAAVIHRLRTHFAIIPVRRHNMRWDADPACQALQRDCVRLKTPLGQHYSAGASSLLHMGRSPSVASLATEQPGSDRQVQEPTRI
ncbi:hypothetical protein HPB47_009134 [Ixodes persulcatus]|uniref:Uncharacterized protein n=1 Tax=Ixodes persulcatus TaxID=34615 RepID=A0AC60P2T6_IXOPE|nr:hypothetical protein HPB47_009134 [Ixodes persulcatus]